MPRYLYTAKSIGGEEKTGTLEARDKHELARALRQEGYVLISASLEEQKIEKKRFEISIPFLERVSLTEKMMFTRNLAIMIAAGISLPRALRTLALQVKSRKFKRALIEIAEEITKGKNFSDSLAKHPDIFSELFQNMVKVGEEAGTLEDVLKTLTRQMEREHELRSKVKGAMIYPSVIISAMIGIGFLMLILVVPRLAETFEELNIELPLTTQLIIKTGTFLANFWYLFILIILAFAFFLPMIFRTQRGKKLIDSLVLKIPIIAPIVKKTNSAYTVRTLSSLIISGVPIVRALEIVSGTVGNIYYRQAIAEAAEKVGKGTKLSESLKPFQNIYPSLVIQMMAVGEETGQTSEILDKLADFYEEEVTSATKNLTAVIEPILMLIIGTVIGFFAISMVQPMYSMLGAI